MVAAARLRRAEQRIEELRPYADAIRRMTARASEAAENIPNLPILEEREDVKTSACCSSPATAASPARSTRRSCARQPACRGAEADGKDVLWFAFGRRGVRRSSSASSRSAPPGPASPTAPPTPTPADRRRPVRGVRGRQGRPGRDDLQRLHLAGAPGGPRGDSAAAPARRRHRRDDAGGEDGEAGEDEPPAARSGSTSRTPRRSSPASCTTTSRFRSSGRCSSRPRPNTARA